MRLSPTKREVVAPHADFGRCPYCQYPYWDEPCVHLAVVWESERDRSYGSLLGEIEEVSGLLATFVERAFLQNALPMQAWAAALCRRALDELGLLGISPGPEGVSTFDSEASCELADQIAGICERLIRTRIASLPLVEVEDSGEELLPEILWALSCETLRETLVGWRAQLGSELDRDRDVDSDSSYHTELASLSQMLRGARLYKSSRDYKELLDFIARLRNIAPFNAMLLHIQKPGMRFAATVKDWQVRFGRSPKEAARPLLIMKPFGPVDLVYDAQDTHGRPLPEDVSAFIACGIVDEARLQFASKALERRKIQVRSIDAGDGNAGSIRKLDARQEASAKYLVHLNRNHTAAVRLATLAHELAHLHLGHLGADQDMKIPDRTRLPHAVREVEAESVAYVVCERMGIRVKSQPYLSEFISDDAMTLNLDIPRIIGVAGDVERWLGQRRL